MQYRFAQFEVDVSLLELRAQGRPLAVQPKVLDALIYLLRNRDRVVSRDELRESVWAGVTVGPNSIVQAIASIRRALGDSAEDFVKTFHSRGYRFVADVEHLRGSPAAGAALPFVGRDAQLANLEQRLEQARSGRGNVAFVSGPPGIGKTRLVMELVERAEARGDRVRTAVCDADIGGQELWPWRQLVAAAAGTEQQAAEDARLFANAGEAEQPSEIFERVRGWLQREARKRAPLLLVLEDLNWADAGSLLLLKALAPDLGRLPVLVLATHRDVPLPPTLARVVGSICRESPSRALQLPPLELPDALRLAAELSPPLASTELVERLWHKTSGNPLFLTQLLHVAVAEELTGPISRLTSALLAPDAVREAIGVHLQGLSEACKAALAQASVLGDSFDLHLLGRLLERPPASVLELLDEACQAQIVAKLPQARDEFRFKHAVVRDVLYRSLGLVERARAHHAAGRALAELYDAGAQQDAREVARHLLQGASAGKLDDTLRWLLAAARRQMAEGNVVDALFIAEHAVEVAAPTAAIDAKLREELRELLAGWNATHADKISKRSVLAGFVGENRR